MRSVLLTPISPRLAGNGLAMRCAMWHEALAGMGSVTNVVAPVAGPAAPGSDEVVLEPSAIEDPTLPRLARGLDAGRGRSLGALLDGGAGSSVIDDRINSSIDLVVVVRSYLGLVGEGLCSTVGAPLVVDLDDDDVTFFHSIGQHGEAERFERLVESVRAVADLVVSTQGHDGTVAVPNCVRVPEVVPDVPVGSRRVLLLGNMGYGPNADAARWFLDSVLPQVRTRVPAVDPVIAGPGSERFDGVGCGYVEDLTALLTSAAVTVAPLRHGSGTRLKILDAWAHGRAVVSTPIGVEGLDARHGEQVLVAADAESFASCVVRTLDDPHLAGALGAAGRRLVVERYTRHDVVQQVRQLLGAVLAG